METCKICNGDGKTYLDGWDYLLMRQRLEVAYPDIYEDLSHDVCLNCRGAGYVWKNDKKQIDKIKQLKASSW